MDGDGVVGVLVGIFGSHTLAQRGEGVGQAGELLEFGLLLGLELAVALDVLQGLVHIDMGGGVVQQGAAGIELGLHAAQHVIDTREMVDGLAELGTLCGILDRLIISLLAQAGALRTDTQAGAVHQGHHVLDQTHAGAAAQFGAGVLVGQLAGRGTVDTELVLDVAHVDAALALVIDEHGQAAAVLGAFLAAGQDQVDVRVTVGDETLHTVQQPAALLLGIRRLEHDALQVGTGVRLGEVHGHGLAGADARDEFLALLLAAKLIEGLGAALQAPDVLEGSVGGGDDLAGHAEDDFRTVQAAVAAGHGDTPQAGMRGRLHVLLGLLRIDHAAVLQVRSLKVDVLGIRGDRVGRDVARDLEQTLVVLDAVLVVDGGLGIGILVSEIAFLQFDDPLHERVLQVEGNLRMVSIIICHGFRVYLEFCL